MLDVLEVWVQERLVTWDYLDARLVKLKADLRKEIDDFRSELKGWVVIVAFLILGVIGAATVEVVHYLVIYPPEASQRNVTSR